MELDAGGIWYRIIDMSIQRARQVQMNRVSMRSRRFVDQGHIEAEQHGVVHGDGYSIRFVLPTSHTYSICACSSPELFTSPVSIGLIAHFWAVLDFWPRPHLCLS
jgi:hypothetical protein